MKIKNVLIPVSKSLLVFGAFPVLFFSVLGHYIYMMRPVFNIDYLIIGSLAPFVGSIISFLLFVTVFGNDLLLNLAPIYHFQIADLVRSFKDIIYIKLTYSLPIIVILGTTALLIPAFMVRLVGRPTYYKKTVSAVLLAFTFFVSAADILNGTSFISLGINESFVNFNIANSGLRTTTKALLSLKQNQFVYQPLSPDDSAMGHFFQLRKKIKNTPHPLSRVVLVVVESMGVFRDSQMAKLLGAPFSNEDIQQHYFVETGSVPFQGSTINGEFRELCNTRLLAYGQTGMPSNCLPHFFHDRGFETIGMHGFTKMFYNRYEWYPKLGFDQIFFAHEMRDMGIKDKCGSGFMGICDTSVAQLIHNQLLSDPTGKRKFLYWMTLNSHLPLEAKKDLDSQYDCNQNAITQNNHTICLHTQLIETVLNSISTMAQDPNIPPTEFIAVGDHMPPFSNPTERSLYVPGQVPYFILTPVKTLLKTPKPRIVRDSHFLNPNS